MAVTGERGRLEGMVVHGSLIAGLTTSADFSEEGEEDIEIEKLRQPSKMSSDGGEEERT